MTIGAICNRDVVTIHRNASVLDAAILMRKQHVGDVIVIEAHKEKLVPIGILTDRDIVVELVATDLDCNVITTGDIMVANIASIKESTGVFEAIQTMTSKGVRRLPVVDDQCELIGIVTLDDLLILLAKELGSLTKLLAREQKNEADKRQ